MNLTFDEMIERTLRPNVHTIFYSLKKVEKQIVQMIKSVLTPLDIDYLKELGWSYSGSVLENPKYTTYDLQDFLKANCPFTITESTHIFPVKTVSIPVGE